MTALELARKLARAARSANSDDAAADAVLNVMHDSASWFCRVTADADGCTVDTPYEGADQRSDAEPYEVTRADPYRQVPLFNDQ